MQIIVLGMHRSGTSLVTRLVNMMGAYFAPEKAALGFAADNPKGFWERRDVLQMNDALLAANGCGWNKLESWPKGELAPHSPPHRQAMKRLVMDMDAFRPWVLKDPRLCLTFPYWKPLLEVPVAVIVHRDPREIARSLELRDGIPLAQGLTMWELHAVSLLNATLGMPRIFVRHADFLAEPVAATLSLLAALQAQDVHGLREPSAREILAFVEPSLYRAKDVQGELSSHRRGIDAVMKGEAEQKGKMEIHA